MVRDGRKEAGGRGEGRHRVGKVSFHRQVCLGQIAGGTRMELIFFA